MITTKTRNSLWFLVVGIVLFFTVVVSEAADDISLSDAYKMALKNNENINASALNINVANQDVRLARSEILPKLRVSGERHKQKQITSFGAFQRPQYETTFGATFRQPIYQGWQSYYGLNLRKKQRTVAQLKHKRQVQEILFNVAREYYRILLARRQVNIAQSSLERAQTQLQKAKAQFDVGKTTKSTVLRAEVQVSESREQLRRSENEVEVARDSLAVELGRDTVPGKLMKTKPEEIPDTSLQYLHTVAGKNRRDLTQTRKKIQAAKNRVKFDKADYRPDVSLTSTYDEFGKEAFHGTEEDWRVQVDVSYPLFTGYRDSAEIKRSKYQLKKAREQYQRKMREVQREVREAYLNLSTQKQVVDTLENQLKSARANYREISAQFEEGLVDAVDVSDALTVLRETEFRLANVRNQLFLERLRLRLATGTFVEFLIEKE